ELDQMSGRARAPEPPIGADVAAAHADRLLGNRVELAQLRLRIEAQEARRPGERAGRVPDRAVGRVRHHRIGARTWVEAHVLAGFGLTRLGELVELAVAAGVEHEREPADRL